MRREHLLNLYDRDYAAGYDRKFLTSDLARPDTEYETKVLGKALQPRTKTWLDVACGTGYFLSRFPEVRRAGLDLSPSMLEIARRANPGVEFHEMSFLDEMPRWKDRWDLVSCMWYSYGLVSSMDEVETLVRNLARWTSPAGLCFVPLADPRLITGVDLPHRLESAWPGGLRMTAILWTYAEEGGRKVHRHQVAPLVETMQELFLGHFEAVAIERYPPASPGWPCRSALLASRKRPPHPGHREEAGVARDAPP